MVTVEINKNDLLNLIGKKISNEEIEQTLFLLKVEVSFSGDTIECELNPDRPDMFSVEGIARAIKGFLGIESPKKYAINETNIILKKESAESRPFIACATIENVQLTDDLIKSLMQIQEKLHATIGRNRKKVAIGVHDLDAIKPPLVYKDVEPEKIRFVPLQDDKEMNLNEILENHPKGVDYAFILQGKEKYPVILDTQGVISFPPIINSERTRVTEKTKNLFIDVTGTDEKSVLQTLNILVCNISERTGRIGSVKISNKRTPQFESKIFSLEIEEINKLLGSGLTENEIGEILERMLYTVVKLKGGKIDVLIPPHRIDILHNVDIIEDVAIGYGYNNIIPILPKIATIGGLSNKEKFSRKVRDLMIGLGFQELMTFILTSKENNFDKMSTIGVCVEIANPVSKEYTICRTWLLPSLLKVLSENKHNEYPQKIFEIGDCVVIERESETRTRTIRKLAGVISHDNVNLTEMKSAIESILKNIGMKYDIKPFKHVSFIDTRCGEIYYENKHIGFFGEIHPRIIENWKLEKHVIGFEIDLEELM